MPSWATSPDDGGFFVWLLRITFAVVALHFLAAWYVRRSREEDAG